MRMDDMNKYFESKGFSVMRKHITQKYNYGFYTFVISKDGKHLCCEYTWPNDQQKFMDDAIEKFEKEFGEYKADKYKSVYTSSYNQYRNDVIDAIVNSNYLINNYCKEDIRITEQLEMWRKMNITALQPLVKIKNVIFNEPATIVFWTDGSKTVVKAQPGDEYDPEKGLAMSIAKKALGNKGNYCNEIKKWLSKEDEKKELIQSLNDLQNKISDIEKEYNPVQKAYDTLKL